MIPSQLNQKMNRPDEITIATADEPTAASSLSKQQLYALYDKRIDELYKFRDNYYVLNANPSSGDQRNSELNARLSALAAELEAHDSGRFETRASYLVLIGRAYNVLPEYSARAFEALTKAIKLDAHSIDAWNALGECYWKKRDFDMCRNCFEQSLHIGRSKLSLRGLSMVMRQLINVPLNKAEHAAAAAAGNVTGAASPPETLTLTPVTGVSLASPVAQLLPPPLSQPATLQQPLHHTQQQQQQHDKQLVKCERVRQLLDESIRFAKESIQMDPTDGMSWYILANCYVAMFFSPFGQQNGQLIRQAISAYNLALRDQSVANLQSDLYFNKSMISLYEEHWLDALECLAKALLLDPYWTEVKDNLIGTLSYLTQLNQLTRCRGKLKPKKLQQLVESIRSSDLGPYQQRQQPSAGFELAECTLADLRPGLNANKALVGKVVCGLPTRTSDNLNIICFTCCIVDKRGDCAALTIYNLAGGHGVIIGNSIAIPEPWLEHSAFVFNLNERLRNSASIEQVLAATTASVGEVAPHSQAAPGEFRFDFRSVRVENPTVLVVNGKKWTREKVSAAFFVPKVIND